MFPRDWERGPIPKLAPIERHCTPLVSRFESATVSIIFCRPPPYRNKQKIQTFHNHKREIESVFMEQMKVSEWNKIKGVGRTRARREMVSLMTWKQSKKSGLAQAVAATVLGTPRAQDEPVLHNMPPVQYHVTARRGAVSPTAEPTRSHSR